VPFAGKIAELWRHPVTSVGGERVTAIDLTAEGVEGDRQYGLIDARDGLPAAPEREPRWRKALHLRAQVSRGRVAQLTFPDRRSYALDDRALNAELTAYFGFAVCVAAYEHTRRRNGFPITRYRHPHFPVHLLTSASLMQLAKFGSSGPLDSRRFRPTALVSTEGEGFVENDWIGRRLRIGSVELSAQEITQRCGVTLVSQPGLEEDPEILRNILRHNRRQLGIYCTIETPGVIRSGDELHVDL
jgi:uncharacterized protein